jgi:hypothetical protein
LKKDAVNFTITRITESRMYLQLNFADPSVISRSQSPDQLVVDVDPFQDLLVDEYILKYPMMLDAGLSSSYMNIPMQSVASA